MSFSINFPSYGTITVSLPLVANLRTYPATDLLDGLHAIVDGQTTVGDGQGGLFRWDATNTTDDNGTTVLAVTGLTTGRWIKTVRTGDTGATGATGPTGPTGPTGDVTPAATAARDAAQSYAANASSFASNASSFASNASSFASNAATSATAASGFSSNASAFASNAAASAATANAVAGSGVLAYQALSPFASTADEVLGTAPSAGIAGPTNALMFINGATSTYDGTLQSFSAHVLTVNDGTGRLAICFPNALGGVTVIDEVLLTGIASTGVKTFTAGIDFPTGLHCPAGAQFALGSATGGVMFSTVASTSNGVSIVANANGYNSTKQGPGSGNNWIGVFQVTVRRTTSVKTAIDATADNLANFPGEQFVTEVQGPDSLVFGPAGDQGNNFFLGNDIPFYSDGKITGIEYCGAHAGDVFCLVFRGTTLVDYRRVTIAVGSRLIANFATPFTVKAGDKLYTLPITGYFCTQNWSTQPGSYSNVNARWSSMTPVALNVQIACRALIQRPRKPRKIAADSSRGFTTTIDQRFRGTTLPGNTTFTATTTSGSNVLTGISGTPVVGSPISGTGLNALLVPFIVSVSGSTATMSQPATASGSITVTQTGWTGVGGTFTQNNGLISPSSATTDWSRRYMHPTPINAQRHTVTASVTIGDLTNIGGICSQAQQDGVVKTLGSVIHIDAPANKGRVYRWSNATGVAPADAGLEVVLPWTLAATDVVTITAQVNRGLLTVTFANAQTGQSATITSKFSAAFSSYMPIFGGVMSGQIGAHFLSGNGGMKWNYIKNITHVANRGPRKFLFDDSKSHMADDTWDYHWSARVEDQYAKGTFANMSKAGQTALGMLATLPQDFAALNPGPGDEVFVCLASNPDNDLGTTDANRYASYKRSIQALIYLAETVYGCSVTFITPTPLSLAPTYLVMVINGMLSGDFGPQPVIDIGRAASIALDGTAWVPLYSNDGLHNCTYTGAPFLAQNFLAQRPDMNGSV